ncbi:unnamed protein product [Strongylus vulgaris]|uniref:Uncharacterized protein n=1 Tax=Strongylus vulgaris TaxID=40348 RepID=A0A3P7IPN1_STRVU|nr:unnamed protein product [Strongylus vulgaris]
MVTNRGGTVPVTTYYRGGSVYQSRTTSFYARNPVSNTVPLSNINTRPTQSDTTTTAPRFFPMSLAATPQFVDNVSMPIQFPLPVRRMVHQVQPLPSRRDIRLTTPTPIMISKKAPIGVDVTCAGTSERRSSGDEATSAPSRDTETKNEENMEVSEANHGDNEETEDDGNTSPDVLRSNEDTWDFWDRVYSDPELRQSMQERQRDSPMAELLHSDKLCKAQLVFFNVPRTTTRCSKFNSPRD